MDTSPTIAFLGIGLMGQPMTRNLLQAGYRLRLWNRTPGKAEAFAGAATIGATPAEAVTGADVVITMLENGPVVDAVLMQDAVLQALSPGTLVIDMSSIPPAMARDHSARLQALGVDYLDAPVSGGTLGAAEARLSIMAGGQEAVLKRARPILSAMGTVTHVGPAGAGQVAKLANQAIVGITIGAVSEALLLAARGGADPAAVREALMGGFAGSRILELHGQRMLDRSFTPGAPARIQLKDLQMILDEAAAAGLNLPLSNDVHGAYERLVASGHGDLDHSSLLLELERQNNTRLDH